MIPLHYSLFFFCDEEFGFFLSLFFTPLLLYPLPAELWTANIASTIFSPLSVVP